MFGREQIPLLEDKIVDLRERIDKIRATMRGLVKYGQSCKEEIPDYFVDRLNANQQAAQALLRSQAIERYMPWDAPEWADWQPSVWGAVAGSEEYLNTIFAPSTIHIGEFHESRGNTGLKIPAMGPFVGQDKTVIIQTGPGQYADGLNLLQSLVIRTALMLPYQVTYTLLDPAHLGESFPMRTLLPSVQNSTQDVRRDLDQVIERISRLFTTFLEHQAFHEVALELRVNEKIHFVFAADFPNKYDHRAIEALERIAETGPRAGTYVFIHHNTEIALPRDVTMDIFKKASYIDLRQPVTLSNSYALEYDQAPPRDIQTRLFGVMSGFKPVEAKGEFDKEAGLPEAEWWCESSDDAIVTPIGTSGVTGRLEIWLGERDNDSVSHGVLGGATGAGKSNLYHVLILGFALRYSPQELRMFLIDGKDGVEFQPYRSLPHAEVVSLKSSPQLSRSVLHELTMEMERRNELFSQVGVANLTQYRRRGQPRGKLPRILLLVDEYQELFEGDKDGHASAYLENIARQGRSVGVHMLLGAQGFVGVQGMLNRNAIFGNIQLRMAMKMPAGDVQALTEFQRQGKQMILTCDLPGKIVVNHQSGNDGENANKLGKVTYLRPELRDELIQKLAEKADQELTREDNPVTIVFDGKAQPNLIENQLVEYLLQLEAWRSQAEMQEIARRPLHQTGFEIADWFAAEHPRIAWIGQDFSVRGQSAVVFRRRVAENALIIGGNDAARYGMLGTILSSLALNCPPSEMQFFILDRSVPGTDWSITLGRTAELVLKPAGYPVRLFKESRDAEALLDTLLEILISRRDMNEDALMYEPDVFCVMTELDRVDDLRRQAGTYVMSESKLGDKLNRIVLEGPTRGIHLIASFSNVRPMSHVIDERHGLNNFRHRIALQMAEEESLTFVRSRRAAMLQNEGQLPVVGLYYDTENDKQLRFKPYSLVSTIDYYQQLYDIGETLKTWRDGS